MTQSVIHVQSRTGVPIKGKRVTLGFSSGLTKPAFTNANGDAVIGHSSSGNAIIYVDGKNQGTFHAPGRYPITL